MSLRNRQTIDFFTKFKSVFETIFDVVTWLGLAIVAMVLVYVLGGVFTGSLFRTPADQMARVVKVVDRASEWMMYAAVVVSYLATIRTKEAKVEIGFGVLVGGLFFWFGFPALAMWMANSKFLETNQASEVLAQNFKLTAQIMLCALLYPTIEWLWRGLRNVPLKKKQDEQVSKSGLRREPPKGPKPKVKPNALSPCWHLPYCRDYLVEMCPAFKAKKRCWKFGGGCFCDSRMIEAMLMGLSKQAAKGSAGGQAYLRSEIEARNQVAKQRLKKTPCHRCFIYLEHQKLKYDVLNPLMYPLAAGLMYFGYEPVVKPLWTQAQGWLTNLWATLAFQEVSQTPEAIAQIAGAEAVTVMVAVLIGMYLLLGLLRLCEMWCFRWKL